MKFALSLVLAIPTVSHNFSNLPNKLGAEFDPILEIRPVCDRGDRIDKFVCEYSGAATRAGQIYGVDPILLLAQAGAESGWGRKAHGHNYFGHKGSGAILSTRECDGGSCYATREEFRVYPTPDSAFRYHAKLLTSDRYRDALEWSEDPGRYFTELVSLGYATIEPKIYGRLMAAVVQSIESRQPIEGQQND